MAGQYLADAAKLFMQHENWDKHAKDFELSLARTLHNDPKVMEATQKALFRMSEVLTGYYGHSLPDSLKGGERKQQTPTALPYTPEWEENKPEEPISQPYTSQWEKSQINVLPSSGKIIALPDEKTIALPDVEREDVIPLPFNPNYISVNNVLIDAYMKNSQGSSGQIGKSDNQEENERNLNEMLNVNGNVREKMTAFFNATNGRKSNVVKTMVNNITLKRAKELGMNRSALLQDTLLGDPLNVYEIDAKQNFLKSPLATIKSLLQRARARSERNVSYKKRQGLGLDFYEQNGMGLSERERALAVKDGKLSWREGISSSKIKDGSAFQKMAAAGGFRVLTGPSGTASRLLRTYKWLGAADDDLLNFRLSLAAWMMAGDHSLYEIVVGAREAGVRGKNEDTSNALMLYQTLDPLSHTELRQAGVDQQFPHEHVLMDVTKKMGRTDASNTVALNASDKTNAPLQALYVYTTSFYKMMNAGVKGGVKSAHKLAEQDHYKKDDEKLAQMSSSVMLGAMPYMKKARGTVYRGTEMARTFSSYGKKGQEITVKTFTSTSTDISVAKGFYKKTSGLKANFIQPVLLEITLKGHGGVDLQHISFAPGEAEILLMAGTRLRVTEPVKKVDDKNVAKLEEVGNPNNKYTGGDKDFDPQEANVKPVLPPLSGEDPSGLVMEEEPPSNIDENAPDPRLEPARQWVREKGAASTEAGKAQLPEGGDLSGDRLLNAVLYVLLQQSNVKEFFGNIDDPGNATRGKLTERHLVKIFKGNFTEQIQAAYDEQKQPRLD